MMNGILKICKVGMKKVNDAVENEAELVCLQPKAYNRQGEGRVLCTLGDKLIKVEEKVACALSAERFLAESGRVLCTLVAEPIFDKERVAFFVLS